MFQNLDTRDSELASVLYAFLVALMKRDDEMRDYVFNLYFQQQNAAALQVCLLS